MMMSWGSVVSSWCSKTGVLEMNCLRSRHTVGEALKKSIEEEH